jgi:hypothetical protein
MAPKPRNWRQRDVKRLLRATVEEGFDVHGIEVDPDGRIRVLTIAQPKGADEASPPAQIIL